MANPFSEILNELHLEPSEGAAPASTEARIIAAALELFAERSYEAATTQAIAKRAGVTERTLFKHFKNKEGLFAKTVFPALLKLIAQEVLLRPSFREAALEFAGTHLGPSLRRFFEEARERGQMRDVPTAFALRSLVSCIAGFLISRLILLPNVQSDEPQEIALISDFVLHGLALGNLPSGKG